MLLRTGGRARLSSGKLSENELNDGQQQILVECRGFLSLKVSKQILKSAIYVIAFVSLAGAAVPAWAVAFLQDQKTLTPLQFEIEQQRRRLESAELEERRDAVMRLGALRRPEASQVAVAALRDPSALVRATAAAAVLSLPADQSAAVLLPLLGDRDEFVRREAAYALGKTGSRAAVPSLVEVLNRDRQDGVRGAAAVALGELGDGVAVVPLTEILVPTQRSRRTRNPFVLLAAARSLGQLENSAGVPVLLATLNNEYVDIEVRREAAIALGRIGDASAVSSLQRFVAATDPYLAEAAREAVKKIRVR